LRNFANWPTPAWQTPALDRRRLLNSLVHHAPTVSWQTYASQLAGIA
jgi:hypothetical protein